MQKTSQFNRGLIVTNRTRRARTDPIPHWIVLLTRLLFVLLLIDPSGDQILILNEAIHHAASGIRMAAICVIIILLFLSFFSFEKVKRIDPLAKAGLGVTFLVLCLSAVHGLLANVPLDALNELQAVIPVACLPILLRFGEEQRRDLAEFIAISLVVIITAKLIVGQIVHLGEFGALSYKALFRGSPLLLFPYALYLTRYLRLDHSRLNRALLLLSLVGILTAQARALNIAAACVSLAVSLRFANLAKSLGFIVLIGIASVLMTWVSDNQLDQMAGRWSGEVYRAGIDYRAEQARILMNRFTDKPLLGYGLGYFTPGYESYEDLAKPFLLELDLPNFASKTGLPLFAAYLATYWLYAVAYRRARFASRRSEEAGFAYVLLIPGLLIYSLFQTFHSSILYWLLYAAAFAFLFGPVSPPQRLRARLRYAPG